MGDFERHRSKTLHQISFIDGKKLLGRVTISASVHLSESWVHLKEEERAGPETRRIVESLGQISVHSHGKISEEKPSKEIQAIVDEIKANSGLVVSGAGAETKKIVGVQDPAFETAFRERMKSDKYVIEFGKPPETSGGF